MRASLIVEAAGVEWAAVVRQSGVRRFALPPCRRYLMSDAPRCRLSTFRPVFAGAWPCRRPVGRLVRNPRLAKEAPQAFFQVPLPICWSSIRHLRRPTMGSPYAETKSWAGYSA